MCWNLEQFASAFFPFLFALREIYIVVSVDKASTGYLNRGPKISGMQFQLVIFLIRNEASLIPIRRKARACVDQTELIENGEKKGVYAVHFVEEKAGGFDNWE